jgi:acyl carrier protein
VTSIEIKVEREDVNESLSRLPIGRPIGNTTVYLLDKWKNLVPLGSAGELYIGGDGVARGYLNNPELTAEKFDQDLWDYQDYQDKKIKSFLGGPGGRFFKKAPLAARGKIYKTGDLARWMQDGNIDFLGRLDHQVKIRGFRIELGEIENRLLKHSEVKETVVTAKSDETGDHFLCAYIVPHSPDFFEVSHLKAYLQERLPDYMVPVYFAALPAIPLTATGKADRKSLPEPGVKSPGEYIAPRSKREELLAEIWSETLGLEKERIGTHDNFFELGGHSLKAINLLGRIHKTFDIEIPLSELFKIPTISGLAFYMNKTGKRIYSSIEPIEKKEYYRLSSAQERLFVIQRMAPVNVAYNMPGIMIN